MSTDFPTTYGAFDNTFNGSGSYGGGDTFVVKVNSSGSGLTYSTYLGGSDDELVYTGPRIALDSNGDVFVVGETRSADFPITDDAFDNSLSGLNTFDLFLSKIDIHATTIAAPVLVSPIAGKQTNDTTPTFTWKQ